MYNSTFFLPFYGQFYELLISNFTTAKLKFSTLRIPLGLQLRRLRY